LRGPSGGGPEANGATMKILAKALRDDTQFNMGLELLAGAAGLGRVIDHPRVQKPASAG
jgi:hypothetical protein